MSYKITEAGRNHVAVIEDLQFKIFIDPKNDRQLILSLEDDDKLDLSVPLPSYSLGYDFSQNDLRIIDTRYQFSSIAVKAGWKYDVIENRDSENYLESFTVRELNSYNADTNTYSVQWPVDIRYITAVITKRLEVNGNATISGTLNVDDNTTMGGTLVVTGKITSNDGLDITGSVLVLGDSNFRGIVDIDSDLNVGGNTTLEGIATISGLLTAQDGINVTNGDVNIEERLIATRGFFERASIDNLRVNDHMTLYGYRVQDPKEIFGEAVGPYVLEFELEEVGGQKQVKDNLLYWAPKGVAMRSITFDVGTFGSWVTQENWTIFVSNGNTVSDPGDLGLEGYDFGGWFEDNAFTTLFDFDTFITNDTTIYGKFDIQQFTVSFDVDGGSAIGSQTVNYNGNVTNPGPASGKTGYTFEGWFTTSALTTPFNFGTQIKANTTIYAGWNINSYTVTFAWEDDTPISSTSVNYNNTVSDPGNPTPPSGYDFGGWYSDKACTTAWSFSTPITGPITIWAKMEANVVVGKLFYGEYFLPGSVYNPNVTPGTFVGTNFGTYDAQQLEDLLIDYIKNGQNGVMNLVGAVGNQFEQYPDGYLKLTEESVATQKTPIYLDGISWVVFITPFEVDHFEAGTTPMSFDSRSFNTNIDGMNYYMYIFSNAGGVFQSSPEYTLNVFYK